MTTTPTLPILEAVNNLLDEVRGNHPDVPPVTIVLGAKGTTRRGVTHGHFHADQWTGDANHEIMLSGESLGRGAVATLGTIIHEAAHATAFVQGVKDTSNNGRYHNKKFKEIAEGMGIELEQKPTLGWSATTVPEATVERYKAGIEALEEALHGTYKKGPKAVTAEPKAKNKTKAKMDCGCDNPVTVSIKWFESKGGIICDDCLEQFKLIEEA